MVYGLNKTIISGVHGTCILPHLYFVALTAYITGKLQMAFSSAMPQMLVKVLSL